MHAKFVLSFHVVTDDNCTLIFFFLLISLNDVVVRLHYAVLVKSILLVNKRNS